MAPTIKLLFFIGFSLVFAPGFSAQSLFPELPNAQEAGTGMVQSCEISGIKAPTKCGRFRVYEDRLAASGRTIDLAFVILKATGPDEVSDEAIIPLPGGPGQSFTNEPGAWLGRWGHFRETQDIVIVDVRGVGASDSISCPEFQIPTEDRFGSVFPPEHIRMCHESISQNANLSLYTTDLSVDDLEELRRWLGYSKVNLTGGSYGTRFAQVYMRRHPDAIRTVIMNSVAPVYIKAYVHMSELLQNALEMVIQSCEENAYCANQYPGTSEKVSRLINQLSDSPVTVNLGDQTIQFGVGDFSYALRGLLYSRARDIPRMIQAAAENEWLEFAQYYLQRTEWIAGSESASGHHFSALCAEDIAPIDDAAVKQFTDGTFMGDHLIAGYREVCKIWGFAKLPEEWWSPVRSHLPVLIISGGHDPVTPPEWGDDVAQYLPNSLHVVWSGGGHVPRNACLQSIEKQFVHSAQINDLDTRCVNGTQIQ